MSKSLEMLKRDSKVIGDVVKLRFYPMTAVSGHGAYLVDVDGKEYLDFNAGWAVANTGYCHPRITEAVHRQMQKLSFSSLCSTMSVESVELAEKLIALTPGNFEKKVWFGHSGSDANELIAKMVPLATGRPRILSFVGSYHGQTMGSYAMSGHPCQSGFIGSGNIVKVPYPYCYRCAYGRDSESCKLACAKYITDYVFGSMYPADQIGAVIVEPVQSDGGDVVPAPGFMEAMYQACQKNGALFISDEVKVGYGRTGKMFGFQHYDVVPDLVVMGKPMGGGQPLSAVVGRTNVLDASVGSHLFTTAGNPVACAAGLEVLKIMEDEKLCENAEKMGAYLLDGLRALQAKYDCIGQVRGRGLILGVELVKNRATREPDAALSSLVVYRSYELGLLYFGSGIHANVLELTPPLIITKQDADKAIAIIDQSIGDALAGRVDEAAVAQFAGWAI